MRKILLATTAVVATAVLGIADASAQQAPTVRVGGYFRFNYAFTDQDQGRTAASGQTFDAAGRRGANLGKSDFTSDAEIHVIVEGKAANGISYGTTIEVQVDQNRQATAGTATKTSMDTDEMYVWVSSPTAGQLRFGDEDGVVLGAMANGFITNFGTGGVDGDAWDNVVGGNYRPAYIAGGYLNDSTKVIYTSPQFFGFDFGASFGFNDAEGEDSGCETFGVNCDRADSYSYGVAGARRKNEVQAALRYRGSFAGVGLAATAGYIGSGATKNTDGASADGLAVGVFGLQATAYGATVGANYAIGRSNAGLTVLNQGIDDRNLNNLFVGASYTMQALTVGANANWQTSAGNVNNPAARKDQIWSVGANYALAPGLALVAEYTQGTTKEGGQDRGQGIGNKTEVNVFIAGIRMAF
ncbi:porin [Teichococcus oryzae]|uniref:Porin n=1 Tax=Teichococcus oryzae TaxID=1608942 RepID=A0A5B2TIP4_9PROT|nr:porin [Pseudoroseomonas oryzae]KAA2213875.1 porin [Pseudoroseomonas oryzae]